ncbi:MAG TPA: hypothetical protein VMC02_11460, partial [Steroidobacteraceae bacterium]|nr:hypothetical protein [Steroidobacteraceae bacterium]
MANGPFRADHVGSLLRPKEVAEARARHARGEIDARALGLIEDQAIRQLIDRQEQLGLRSITDGECRRENWGGDFLKGLGGTRVVEREVAAALRGGKMHAARKMQVTTVNGRIRFIGH